MGLFLLSASGGPAGAGETGGEGVSFPALRSLHTLLLKEEKRLGLIPSTLGEEREFPEDLVPSEDEIAGLAFAEYLIETGMADQAAGVLKKLIGTRENGPFIRMALEALQRAYYRNGEYKKSLAVYYKISSDRKAPPAPGTLLMAGNSYLRNGDFRPALQTLSHISPDRTHYPFALYSMGQALFELEGGERNPVWTLKKLVRLNPGDDPVLSELVNRARLTLALLLKTQNKDPEALDFLEQISPESRFYPAGLYESGVLLSKTGSCVKAIVVFENLRDLSPVSDYGLEALFRIGVCYSRLKAFRNSVDRFRLALENLQNEKKYLEEARARIGRGERVSVSEIQKRFIADDGPEGPNGGKTWALYFKEMALLKSRVERVNALLEAERGESSREILDLKAGLEKAKEEVESAYRVKASGSISDRIHWIEDLTQRTTLQLARHIILIQDHEATP